MAIDNVFVASIPQQAEAASNLTIAWRSAHNTVVRTIPHAPIQTIS